MATTTPKPPSSPPKAARPAVTLRQGQYVGTVILASSHFPRAVEAWRGVPYAQTTAGKNRFRPPVPLPPSNATFDALVFGQTCARDGRVNPGTGEDCLSLNVYRTAGAVDETKKKLLPVIIYVHGGAFNGGCGVERNMASFVSWAEAPMIGINFNYRVGPLGFLPSALTAREGLLNLGLRDQQLLFQWVQDNIATFGGDPDNVTIMGLSAGAHSVGHHLMYYARSPDPAPFQKAIMESGATTARAVFWPTHPRHLIQFREFLAGAGVAGVPEEDVFDRLRELPLQTILTASKAVWDKYTRSVTWPFQPVIDAPRNVSDSYQAGGNSTSTSPPVIIPDLPIQSWREGKNLRIPVLTGYNTNEGAIFIPTDANTNEDFRNFFRVLIPGFSEADLDALDKLYPDPVTDPSSPYVGAPADKGKQWLRLDAAYSHYAYICPVLQTAHFLSSMSLPVYVYRYAALARWHKANHADEAAIVSHDMSVLGGERLTGLRAVSDAMHGAFARFIVSKAGDPNENAAGRVEWPAFRSPFSGEGALNRRAAQAWRGTVKKGEVPSGDLGRKIVFGEGNDERAEDGSWLGSWRHDHRHHEGIPAQAEALTDLEMAACRFWWSRVELSEGLGVRAADEDKIPARAKL